MTWIQWVFSGVGVSLFAVVFRVLFQSREARVASLIQRVAQLQGFEGNELTRRSLPKLVDELTDEVNLLLQPGGAARWRAKQLTRVGGLSITVSVAVASFSPLFVGANLKALAAAGVIIAGGFAVTMGAGAVAVGLNGRAERSDEEEAEYVAGEKAVLQAIHEHEGHDQGACNGGAAGVP